MKIYKAKEQMFLFSLLCALDSFDILGTGLPCVTGCK